VTRDDLVGQYIGHTAPKTKEVLKKAMGGVLFIDEAYYLYRPENERDYGQEAIEILLQVMENQRDDLVVILAGYKDRMDTFFQSNPGHELAHRAPPVVPRLQRRRTAADRAAHARAAATVRPRRSARCLSEYLRCACTQPHFCQRTQRAQRARPHARLRQASRLFADRDRELTRRRPVTITAADIRASRVFVDGTLATPNAPIATPSTACMKSKLPFTKARWPMGQSACAPACCA
jgi:hypothetical protein